MRPELGHEPRQVAALPVGHGDEVEGWVTAGMAGVKICEFLARNGVVVGGTNGHRFITTEFGRRRAQGTPGVRAEAIATSGRSRAHH